MDILADRLSGVIAIIGGLYGLLLAYRVLPRNSKRPGEG